jgi:hypothetical protein
MSVDQLASFLYNNVHEDDGGALFIEDKFVLSEESVYNWLESEANNG